MVTEAPRGSTARIVMWLAATAVVVVLLFADRTSTSGATSAPPSRPPGVIGRDGPGAVVNGSVVRTGWGPVQVQVTVSDGRIVDVRALTYPSGTGHDSAINSYALPQLRREVLAAQSARIDAVSGATVTSDGYRESLRAALDAAHFRG